MKGGGGGRKALRLLAHMSSLGCIKREEGQDDAPLPHNASFLSNYCTTERREDGGGVNAKEASTSLLFFHNPTCIGSHEKNSENKCVKFAKTF